MDLRAKTIIQTLQMQRNSALDAIADMNAAIAERDLIIKEKDSMIIELHNRISEMEKKALENAII